MVHRQLPGITSLSEFIGGDRDACGPYAEEEGLAAQQNGETLSWQHAEAIRKRDIVQKWFTPGGGEPIGSVYNDLMTFEHVHIIDYEPYNENLNMTDIRNKLIQFAGTYPIVIEVAVAYNLPGNESGVHYHFVTIVGIDSATGYLVLNPDDVNALSAHQTYSGRWVNWNQLLAAHIVGMIVFDRSNTNPMKIPTNWHDDGSKLTAPNGHICVFGVRDHIINSGDWNPNLVPLDEEIYDADGNSAQHFGLVLKYTKSTNVVSEAQGENLAGPSETADETVKKTAQELSNVVDVVQQQLATVKSYVADIINAENQEAV